MMIEQTYLELKWTVSRARDTYGYNVVTLTDQATSKGKRYRASGGGYDMVGTVFGDWLDDTYQDRLWAIREQAYSIVSVGNRTTNTDGFYGMTWNEDKVTTDGGCGLESMRKIAEAIGVHVKATWNRKGHTTGFMITVDDAS